MIFWKQIVVGDVGRILWTAIAKKIQVGVHTRIRPLVTADTWTMRSRVCASTATEHGAQHADSCPLPRRICTVKFVVVFNNFILQPIFDCLCQLDSASTGRSLRGTLRILVRTCDLILRRSWCAFRFDCLRFTLKPISCRLRIQRIDSPQIMRNRTSTRELVIARVRVLRCLKIYCVSLRPRIRAHNFVFADLATRHVSCLTNGSIDQPFTRKTLPVVVQSFARRGANVDRYLKRYLTIFFIFFFMWLPCVAIESAVDISIPSLAIRFYIFSFALNICFVVEVTVPASTTFRNIW